MPRTLAVLILMLAALTLSPASGAVNANPPPHCDARAVRALGPVEPRAQQTLVVESFGACADPLLVIWIDRPPGRVQHLHFARLAAYAPGARTRRAAAQAVADIMARIEPRPASAIESWTKLHAEDDAPGGASWAGTRLAKPDHDRIRSSAKHILLIPTDTTRGKLTAWDDTNEEWVDMVYYGD